MTSTIVYELLTPPRFSEKTSRRTLLKENNSEGENRPNRMSLITPHNQEVKEKLPSLDEPYTPPQSMVDTRSLTQDVQDENFQVGLVQFINAHNRAEVSYNAVTIDIRCDNYHDLIRAFYEACPRPGVRWGIASIDVLWELPVSMTTVESGNYRETPFRGMQRHALRNILRLMNARGWRDLFVVKYIEG
ncbi:hypothetical protein GcM3_144006 [Golovinomyces cichoracearum]|uniref:Uncharacterized protein n=1 Tax=Golovinomyces cichoracearum TaxID=62708 RepID=A0A420HZB9_9PEZI|nr:hypothetical protein GcM3_144006 [Golovinomyces cichoracearum]